MSDKPVRRYRLIAVIQGDDPAALRSMVSELQLWLIERGDPPRPGDSIHGGPSQSWIVQLEERPEITPEKYREALGKYLDETRLPSFEPKEEPRAGS